MNKQKSINNSIARMLFWSKTDDGERDNSACTPDNPDHCVSCERANNRRHRRERESISHGPGRCHFLIDAAEKYDEPVLDEIFGPDGRDIVHTGEPARDKENANDVCVTVHAPR